LSRDQLAFHPLFGGELFRNSYVLITAATHAFMQRDSYIDCKEVKRFALTQVEAHINANTACLKGTISLELRGRVIEAIRQTPCLSPYEKARYVAALSATGAPI
jgi:hypothetical protein